MVFYCQMWEREVKMNMEAIKEAQKDLLDIIEDPISTLEIVAEAKENYEQLEDSKTYYHWLNDLVESIRSGKIFELIPKKNE